MTNYQDWFNKEFPKDKEKIKIKYEEFKGILIIEDYSALMEIKISDVDGKIERLILRNLNILEKCSIKNCKLENLTIENCPQIKRLNVCSNSLANLEFVKNLTKLSTLEIDVNKELSSGIENLPDNLENFSYKGTKLFKILESYNNDWKSYKQYLKDQGINEEENNRRELLSLREEKKELEEKYKNLKNNVGDLVNYVEEKLANDPKTKEIISSLRKGIKSITDENIKLKNELEQFKPLFSEEEPVIEASKLGNGSFGTVYKGTWKSQFAAVKKPFINISSASEDDLIKLRKELKLLKNLRSSYTIQYYGEYQKDNDFYIIMEYAKYGSLTDFIINNKDKEHNWKLNYNFVNQMTKGLRYLHNEEVLHRDLKSHNVLICEGYIAKLADFGLSKLTTAASSSKDNRVGTFRWWAPEIIIHEQKHTKQSDIYSLGMVIWEIVAKKTVPFVDLKDDRLVSIKYCRGEREEIPADTPKFLKEIIQGCWKEIAKEDVDKKIYLVEERISLTEILTKIEEILKIDTFEQLAQIQILPK